MVKKDSCGTLEIVSRLLAAIHFCDRRTKPKVPYVVKYPLFFLPLRFIDEALKLEDRGKKSEAVLCYRRSESVS